MLVLTLGLARRASAGAQFAFPRPASMEPNVQFWVDVFTAYSVRDFVLTDRDNVWRVYKVFHLPGEGQPTREEIDWVNAYLKLKYGGILSQLASGRGAMDYDQRQVAALFPNASPSSYALAAENLRVQQGMREQFRLGLLRSRYYRPTMERVFRSADLPPELVTLAAVESGFQGGAKSDAGAVGIWQFTRSTGSKYMKISRRHDDRLNPERETLAAAKLLRYNYDTLGDWPLAITAYNYGTGGTARAAAVSGNDYGRMIQSYSGPHFGFAVKNYYAEFLAALQVHDFEDAYFPGIADEATIPPARIKNVVASSSRSSSHHSSHHSSKSNSSLRRASTRASHHKKSTAQKT